MDTYEDGCSPHRDLRSAGRVHLRVQTGSPPLRPLVAFDGRQYDSPCRPVVVDLPHERVRLLLCLGHLEEYNLDGSVVGLTRPPTGPPPSRYSFCSPVPAQLSVAPGTCSWPVKNKVGSILEEGAQLWPITRPIPVEWVVDDGNRDVKPTVDGATQSSGNTDQEIEATGLLRRVRTPRQNRGGERPSSSPVARLRFGYRADLSPWRALPPAGGLNCPGEPHNSSWMSVHCRDDGHRRFVCLEGIKHNLTDRIREGEIAIIVTGHREQQVPGRRQRALASPERMPLISG